MIHIITMDIKDLFPENSGPDSITEIAKIVAPSVKEAGLGLGYAISEGIDRLVSILFPND